MDSNPPKRSPLLLLLLALFILAVLLFLVALINYAQHPLAIPTITPIPLLDTLTPIPTNTPSPTSTITLTSRPTWTLRPSSTVTDTPAPTRSATSTLIRTATPAKPARYNDYYELKPWDLVQQQRTIELLKANTVLTPSKVTYSILAYAEGEALLRFPESIDAVSWRWDRAYSLLNSADSQALSVYTSLIKSAISSGQARLDDLPSWFAQYETRLTLSINSFSPQPGELGRALIEITGEGSAYLWLIETPLSIDIYPLINDIDYDQPHQNDFLSTELTGDDTLDLVIYRITTPGLTQFTPPHIFDLSGLLPAELPLQDQIPLDFGLEPRTELDTGKDAAGQKYLRLTSLLMPSCPTYVDQTYTWNGVLFTASAPRYRLAPVNDLVAYCEIVLDEASLGWGPQAALAIAEPMLGVWPPKTDTQGRPFSAQAVDELRYRLGVLNALADQPSKAIAAMTEITAAPAVPNSTWIDHAQVFLHLYEQPEDLFIACQQADFCNLRDALQTMVRYSATRDPAQTLVYLQEHGVPLRSSGLFDFDQDGQSERWMIMLPKPGSKLEFWILSPEDNNVQAVFVQLFEGTESFPYYHEPAGVVPVVQLELHKGFIFKKLKESNTAYI
ncbi:MAG: hypothetical protein ACM3H7_00435, partial [Acidobacteriaceae bacterium]